MKQRYLVKYIEGGKFSGITTTTTFNLEKFCLKHQVIEAYECQMKGNSYADIIIGKKVI